MTLDGLSVSSRRNANGRSASGTDSQDADEEETQETQLSDVEMSGETLDEESTFSASTSVQGVSQNLEAATLDGDTQIEVCYALLPRLRLKADFL